MRAHIFEPPAPVGFALEAELWWKWLAGKSRIQIKPQEPSWRSFNGIRGRGVFWGAQMGGARANWRLAHPAKTDSGWREFNEPARWSELRRDQCQWRLAELDQGAAILVGGEHNITSQFRVTLSRLPKRLPFLDMPAGLRSDEKGFAGRLAAAAQRDQGQQS